MKSMAGWAVSTMLGVALLVGALAGTAAGESRNRALERALGKASYGAEEGKQIQRSFSAAREAGVAERDALSLVELCADGGFDAAQAQRALSIAAQLALEDLPLQGYVAKLEEGVSKRVPADRVLQAAERRGLALNKAKVVLNAMVLQGISAGDRDELLPDLAEAIEAGRTPEDARAILAEALEAGDRPGTVRRKLFP